MVAEAGSQIGSRDVGPESAVNALSHRARAFGRRRPPRTHARRSAVQLETYPRWRYVETHIFLVHAGARRRMPANRPASDVRQRTSVLVLVADDHSMVRTCLRMRLANESDVEVVTKAGIRT